MAPFNTIEIDLSRIDSLLSNKVETSWDLEVNGSKVNGALVASLTDKMHRFILRFMLLIQYQNGVSYMAIKLQQIPFGLVCPFSK
jgi:hypothetical protein